MKKCTDTIGWQEAKKRSEKTNKELLKKRIDFYKLSPKVCTNCYIILDYSKRYNKYCSSSCAAIKNNRIFPKRISKDTLFETKERPANYSETKINIIKCSHCEKEFTSKNKTRKYCSNKCQQNYQMLQKIEEGCASSTTMKGYLIKKFGAKCSLCGWDKVNEHTKKCPIEIDHIDGDSNNNTPENCRILCPNCHSLTSTYKALNKGKGRHKRMQRYKQGKSF